MSRLAKHRTSAFVPSGLWCMDDGHDPVGFPCAGLDDVCPWFYEELAAWKAR